MKKNYIKVYGYAVIMIVCVIAIVLIACLSENRLDSYQEEYENTITVNQKQIESLEKEIAMLSDENKELKKKVEETLTLQTELEGGQQAMSDMKEIYSLYKSGSKTEAKNRFSKIEPIGFDDMCLAYYELLKDYLR